MSVAIITGSSGLIGSETAKFLHEKGLHIVGIDNDMRKYFFGDDASTSWNTERLKKSLANFTLHPLDIRDQEGIQGVFKKFGKDTKSKLTTLGHYAAFSFSTLSSSAMAASTSGA